MKLYIIIGLLIIFSLGVVSAIDYEYVFKQNTPVDLKFSCFDETTGEPCDTNYLCNITVYYPNFTVLINNDVATRNPSYYNYSITDTSTLGLYQYQSFCTNGTSGGWSPELYYLINTMGEDFNLTKSVLYLSVLILSLGIFGFCIHWAIKIPFDNKRGKDGIIVGMNDLKFLKIFLWFFVYLLAIFIMFMAKAVTGVLEIGLATSLFNLLFWMLLVFLLPVFIVTTTVIIVRFFADRKIEMLVNRNIRVK